MNLSVDVLIIGGGQAGLAAGYHLRDTELSFAILDASPRIGDSWRRRYDTLTLFTPRRFSALPGLGLEGDPEGYADKDEFAAYLEAYARRFELPVHSEMRVTKLTQSGAKFEVETARGPRFEAAHVVVASGAFQDPIVPSISQQFGPGVAQFTVSQYRNPVQLPPGTVLIVGDGASGRDIAAELSSTRKTFLSRGRPRRLLPERLFGRSIWWWLDRLGLMRAGPNSLIGRVMRRTDPFPDRKRSDGALAGMGITLSSRLIGATGRVARFADNSADEVAAVVWAVGYRDENDWIAIPEAKDRDGSIQHNEGVSPVEGIYFLGRPWQRNRASALIKGVGDDAALVVAAIAKSHSGEKGEPGVHTSRSASGALHNRLN